MMYSEFIKISGLNIDYKQYTEIVEPMYMAIGNMNKQDFIKFITPSVKTLIKETVKPKEKTIKKMLVRDNSGRAKTPNGCWYHIEYVELVDVNIKTGKFIIAPLEEEDFDRLRNDGCNLDLSTSYDFDYTNCMNQKNKPIVI